MASQRRARWIETELDGLVESGVLAPPEAQRVREHYRGAARRRPALPLFAVLGAVLIGLGVILLLAHNWEALSRGVRVGIAGGWLLVGQGVAGFALWRRAGSTAWSEAGALFASFSLAGSLALISQTYQLPGDAGAFIATWAWLTLPVAYALDSRASIALVIALAGARLLALLADDASPWPFWALLAATAPYAVALARRPVVSARDGLVAWIAAPVLVMGSLLQLPLVSGLVLGLLAFCVSAGLYALGAHTAGERLPAPYAATAARSVGAGAIAAAVLLLGHGEVWDAVGDEPGSWLGIFHALPPLLLGALALWVIGWRARGWWAEREWARLLVLAAPLAYLVSWCVGLVADSETAAAWSMAGYALALGSATVLSGLEEASIPRANAGMLLLGAAIALRFLDSDWSFTARGLVFIALGAAFLALNLRLRRRARLAEEASA